MVNKIVILATISFISIHALAKSAAKTLNIVKDQSKVEWVGSKKIGSTHSGAVAIEYGTVTMEKDLIKSGEIVINMQSIEVLDIPKNDENNAKLAGHLKSDDFFSVDKFPQAKLVVKSSKKLKEGEYEVTGDLTIKGKTLPIKFPVTLNISDTETKATGKIKIDRTQFGIKYGSGNFFKLAADRIINDEFELNFSVIAQ